MSYKTGERSQGLSPLVACGAFVVLPLSFCNGNVVVSLEAAALEKSTATRTRGASKGHRGFQGFNWRWWGRRRCLPGQIISPKKVYTASGKLPTSFSHHHAHHYVHVESHSSYLSTPHSTNYTPAPTNYTPIKKKPYLT